MNRGILYGIGAYTLWGLFPIYWKALHHVPALEILAHRMVWSLLFVLVLLAVKRNWDWIKTAVRQPKTLLIFTVTASLLAVNWFTYIWGVNAGYIIETSLGYFINPLIYVLLGAIFLRERPRGGQLAAVGLALAGVIYLTFRYGSFPWIALTLAISFGLYGLLRKTAPLDATEGFSLETALLFIPAFAYVLYQEISGNGSFFSGDPRTTILLMGAGVATAVPLLLFAMAARRITLTNLGLLQYIAPSMQFLIGVFIYKEAFSGDRLIGFGLIWLALTFYSIEGIWQSRKQRTPPILEDVHLPTD